LLGVSATGCGGEVASGYPFGFWMQHKCSDISL